MRKIAVVLGIIVIFCTACGKVDSQSIQNNTYENTTDEETTKFDLYDGRIDVDNSYDGIAGGFYICDENKQPILNNQIIESEVYALVNEVFEELSPASREVYMKSLEGKSHKEIAEELNIAVNTIKKHKNNANHYLRSRLEKLICLMTYLG